MWVALCLTLTIFPQLETVGRSPNHTLVIITSVLSGILSLLYIRKIQGSARFPINLFPTIHFAIAGLILCSTLWYSSYQVTVSAPIGVYICRRFRGLFA